MVPWHLEREVDVQESSIELTPEKRRQIAEYAKSVCEELHLVSPANLDDAVKKLGGRIEFVPPGTYGTEASIVRQPGPDSFTIRLEDDKIITRQRFSLAHEIGHLFLHMGYLSSRWTSSSKFSERYDRSGYGEQELEAYEFAAALLMPETEFRALHADGLDAAAIAQRFGVSRESATNRGKWLGIYPW